MQPAGPGYAAAASRGGHSRRDGEPISCRMKGMLAAGRSVSLRRTRGIPSKVIAGSVFSVAATAVEDGGVGCEIRGLDKGSNPPICRKSNLS